MGDPGSIPGRAIKAPNNFKTSLHRKERQLHSGAFTDSLTAVFYFALNEKEVALLDGLTVKQRKFVAEYVKTGNATKSALSAGYSEKTAARTGSENLQKPLIKQAIDAKMAEIESHKIMDAVEYLQTLTSIARGETTEEQLANNGDVVTLKTRTSDRLAALRELGKRFPASSEIEQKAMLQKLIADQRRADAEASIAEAKAKAIASGDEDKTLALEKVLDALEKAVSDGSE
ncbi:MAG: terminase small subunit [Lactobacillus delbrueckii]